VVVASPEMAQLKKLLNQSGYDPKLHDGKFIINGADVLEIGIICAKSKITLTHLEQSKESLEDIFLSLTSKDQQYKAKRAKKI